MGIGRKFRIMDDDGSDSIDMEEFKKGMRETGLVLDPNELEKLFRHFDRDGSGDIEYDEFMRGLHTTFFEHFLGLSEGAHRSLGATDEEIDAFVECALGRRSLQDLQRLHGEQARPVDVVILDQKWRCSDELDPQCMDLGDEGGVTRFRSRAF